MRRPLRSVMLCNPAYLSSYVLGVGQAMGQLGAWHRALSVLDEADVLARQLEEMRPDVIWTHTVPWVPRGAPAPGWLLLEMLAGWRARGARVLLHDGDPRAATRFPQDLSAAVDVALCNHRLSRLEWHVRTVRWPYAAMAQREMAEPREDLLCHLLFAGIVPHHDSGLYSGRSEVLGVLREMLGANDYFRTGGPNDRMQAADVAVSARAVLGFGRPEVPGWVDTRIFQYPGAGGLLLHDDAGGFLEPGVHFVAYQRGPDAMATAKNIVAASWLVEQDLPEMRARAFSHVQAHHTWLHRVEEALALLWGPA